MYQSSNGTKTAAKPSIQVSVSWLELAFPTVRLCAGTLLLVRPAPAHALILSCSSTGITPVAFGSYDGFATALTDSTGTISVSCLGALPGDNITIGISSGGGGSFAPRSLSPGADSTHDHNLYTDAARTVAWGDGTGGSAVYGPVTPPTLGNLTLTVYGRIPALQSVPAGSFGDTVVVTVSC
mgnify:CR=1 FL=1